VCVLYVVRHEFDSVVFNTIFDSLSQVSVHG